MRDKILNGKTALGIELGSTRIKAVLVDDKNAIIATGDFAWENKYINRIWTYALEDIWTGVQTCYKNLRQNIFEKYGVSLETIGAIGISAMMHGYMVFDKDGSLLTPFRTWRNNNAEEAAQKLTALFNYQIPARWSIAHLYQAVLNKEAHIPHIDFQTTLAGYIHYKLTGEKVIGIGEASGMFPVDIKTKRYNKIMADKFSALEEVKKAPWRLEKIMPKILLAGENAGRLTPEGAKLLDISGTLKAGIPFCPPEGDAGTGMVATNSVKKRTGNISAGTSIFGMIVLEKELSRIYKEIDLVTTPTGDLVAMVHCNNCTGEINAWVNMFEEFLLVMGVKADKSEIYSKLYNKSLDGDADCGDVLVYNYLSGENITGIDEGRPIVARTTESSFNLSNFIRAQLYSAMATLKIGMDILTGSEKVIIDSVYAHGGLFKVKGVCQKYLAAAINAPVTVMETAGEGGPWGMAILASYMINKNAEEALESYLLREVFTGQKTEIVLPDSKILDGFNRFTDNYKAGLPIVKEAVKSLKTDKK